MAVCVNDWIELIDKSLLLHGLRIWKGVLYADSEDEMPVTVRYSRDVLEYYRSIDPDWQARIDAAQKSGLHNMVRTVKAKRPKGTG